TYRALAQQVARLADGLARIGVGRGTHVGVMLPNGPEFPVTWLAIATLGAVMIPINVSYTAREVEYVTSDASAQFLVTGDGALAGAAAGWMDDPQRMRRLVVCHGPDAALPAGAVSWNALAASGSDDFTCAPPQPSDLLNIQYTS